MIAKKYALIFSSVAVIALATMSYYAFWRDAPMCHSNKIAGGKAAIGGPFTLVDQFENTVTDKDVIDGLTLVYFGYTYCPDVCPFDVARNLEAIDILDAKGQTVKPVFITIDPARDTPEALADYAEVTHPRLVALTGTDEQISVASKAYKTFYSKNGDGEDYLIDHSTFSYLMDQNGLLEYFRRQDTSEQMAEMISCYANI